MRHGHVRKILGALALASAATAAVGSPYEMGPFIVGMSFDAARASTPGLAWRDGEKSKFSNKLLSIVAEDGIVLGGLSHSVELRPGYYQWYTETFAHSEPVAGAAACERLSLPVLVDLEKRFGTFRARPRFDKRPIAHPTPIAELYTGLLEGNPQLSIRRHGRNVQRRGPEPFVLVEVGATSLISFETDQDVDKKPRSDEPEWRVGTADQVRPDTPGPQLYVVRFESNYRRASPDSRVCALVTMIQYRPERPPNETITVDAKMIARQPSIGFKHLSVVGVALGPQPVAVDLYCGIQRATGALDCSRSPGERAQEEFVIAAIQRSRAMRLEPAALDPDNPVPLRTILRITLAASDRQPIDFLNAPRMKMGEVAWAERPGPQDLQAVYPHDLLRQGLTAKVHVICQIEEDLALLCATTDPSPDGDSKALDTFKKFAWAGSAIMTQYRSAPQLKSGAPAVGAVVASEIDFKPAD